MDKQQAGQESTSKLFSNIVTLMVFVLLMGSFIYYFNDSEKDMKYVTMEGLQQRFARSVELAHWQWVAEGSPNMIVLVHYSPRPGSKGEPIESGRSPLQMNTDGFPRVEASSEGCEKLWKGVLNIPLSVDGFKVFAEYFSDTGQTEQSTQQICRFRLSVGPRFDYQITNGRVSNVTG
ncbi:hypothetical protein [Aliiglaciecola sp. LCG003]|uniref:hypothetical protein n=1 Tax=Aliiglaciecola sp. LCG003 TaxID=3053655 RepID=UPI002573FAD1|nr:hypothetical protein [Aliiglaciecola sp. LCG003]WJG09708.1 hypothetical protein QR722_01330 [Aliiglaciecola sp. LCG003]